MSKMNASLRAARQARIAERSQTVLEEKVVKAEPEVKAVEQVVAPAVAPVAPVAEKVEEVKDLVMEITDPETLTASSEVSMHLFGKDSMDPHWLVCANGQPVAQVCLSDQDDPDGIRKAFVTEQYANYFIEASKKTDFPELLKNTNARTYIAKVKDSDAFKSIQAKVASEATENLRKTKANLRGDMINMLNLVVSAQTKNFIAANALKDSLFNKMRESGMEAQRATTIIESSWQEHAPKYFDDSFKQAGKWMDLAPEAFEQLKEQIVGMPTRVPTVEASAPKGSYPKEALNVDLVTASSHIAEIDDKSKLRQTLGFRRRLTNQ